MIKIGMVGLKFGLNMVENQIVSGPGSEYFQLGALCDMDTDALDKACKKFNVKGYASLDELLADDEIPVIGLFTGPIGRADLIRKIVDAGKDIMTTKPFELDPDAALDVLKYAQSLGRVVHLNSPIPVLSDDMKLIRHWQEKYNLGRPVAARQECWYKSIEKADGSWYDDPDLCPAAPIFRLGIYGINDMVTIFGQPESVQVMESRIFTGRPTADLAQISIKFKDGSITNFLSGWAMSPNCSPLAMTLYFENGLIFRNQLTGELPDKQDKVEYRVVSASYQEIHAKETKYLERSQVSMSYRWDLFHRAINGEKLENQTSPEQIADAIKIIQAMKQASKTGQTVKV